MAEQERKDSFLLYQASYKQISLLSNEEAGMLLKALFEYNADGTLPDLPRDIMLVFVSIQYYMDANTEKWRNTVDGRKKAGRNGGLAKARNAKQNVANVANARIATQDVSNVANVAEYEYESEYVYGSEYEGDPQTPTPTPATPPEPDNTTKKPAGQYGHVLLTDAELERLKQCRPKDWQAKLQRLDDYMEQSGKTYKNHLLTILKWAEEDDQKEASQRKQDGVHFALERKQTGTEDFFTDIFSEVRV